MCDDDDLSVYNDDTVHNMWVDNSYYMNTGEQPYLNSPQQQVTPPTPGPRLPAPDVSANSGNSVVGTIIVLAFAAGIIALICWIL